MPEKRRVLSDEELMSLEGLDGLARRVRFEQLKEIRKRRRYGGGYRDSANTLLLPDETELDGYLEAGIIPFKSFRDGRTLRVPLSTDRGVLVMPFEADTNYGCGVYTVRYDAEKEVLNLQGDPPHGGTITMGFVFCRGDDMGHMLFDGALQRRGLPLTAAIIARDHAMAKYGFARVGWMPDDVESRFTDIFERAGYTRVKPEGDEYIGHRMEYRGETDGRNNLETHYRFVGADPKTGQRKSIYRRR